jgi:hypothetical protein
MATDGSLGRRIFSNDNASDLREDYRKLIGDGVSGVEATDRLIQEWAPDGDPDFEPVFWLAPAVTQWDCGRLEDRVKQRAVAAISDGSGVAPWAGGPDERKRRAVLEAARRKLESPQPAPKNIKKRVLATCDWERGELIAYRRTARGLRRVADVRSLDRRRRNLSGLRTLRLAGNIKHPLAKDYARKPRNYPNPSLVVTWGNLEEQLGSS